MQKINIYGAGLFGVLLAHELSEQDKLNQTKIDLIEKSPTILQSWNSVILGKSLVNGGFHGIEVPRAEKTIEILSRMIDISKFKRIENYKLIMINREVIPFRNPLSLWPEKLINDMRPENLKRIEESGLSSRDITDIFNESELGRTLVGIHTRYSDHIEDCIHLLYPWFLPSEFIFKGDDEGHKNQEMIKEGSRKSHYLIPEKYIFSSLKDGMQQSLKDKDINVETGTKKDIKKLISEKKGDEINIWSASSLTLAKILKLSIHNEATQNQRYIHLAVMETIETELEEFFRKYPVKPSEIMCATKDSIGLSRISFPISRNHSGNEVQNTILIEYYSKSPEITFDEIKKIKEIIEDALKIKTKINHNTVKRPIVIFNPKKERYFSEQLEQKLAQTNIQVPYKYWWPINMAKCGEAIEEAKRYIGKTMC